MCRDRERKNVDQAKAIVEGSNDKEEEGAAVIKLWTTTPREQ